jgi:hypothetical protein
MGIGKSSSRYILIKIWSEIYTESEKKQRTEFLRPCFAFIIRSLRTTFKKKMTKCGRATACTVTARVAVRNMPPRSQVLASQMEPQKQSERWGSRWLMLGYSTASEHPGHVATVRKVVGFTPPHLGCY